jgi:GNAT superfamily N-acetyltransferase
MSEGRPAKLQWRPMVAVDLTAVYALSEILHPDYIERAAVLAEKLALFPEGCFVLAETHRAISGYCFSHPWLIGPPPALDRFFGTLPPAAATYFIHDLAIEPSLQGKGHAASLMANLVAVAMPFGCMRLVAVKGSESFWSRMEFRAVDDPAMQSEAHAKYGDGAVMMERLV